MKILPRRFLRNILVVDPSEMDQVDWHTVKRGCIFLDLWGKIHLELHHAGFQPFIHNTNWHHLFIRQDLLYQSLPHKILASCRAKPMQDLIGARQFIYIRKARLLLPSGVAILPWDEIQKRGDEKRNSEVGQLRRNAFDLLFESLDQVAHHLKAKAAFFPSQPIPPEKMQKHDCLWLEHPPLLLTLFKWLTSFPLRNQRIYVKSYVR